MLPQLVIRYTIMLHPDQRETMPESGFHPFITKIQANRMKQSYIDDLKIRTIKCFTDIIILKYLKRHSLSNGYQIIKYLNDDYGLLFSPGTVYSAVYLLERKGLIKADGGEKGRMENGRIYHLTDEGEKTLNCTVETSKQIQEIVSEILSKGATTFL